MIKKANISKILEKYGNDEDILNLIDERSSLYRHINKNRELDAKANAKLEDMLNYFQKLKSRYLEDRQE